MRRAMAGDALVVAALRLKAARAVGAPTEPGFLDRCAAAWDPERYPTWVAERDGSHAGVLIAQVVPDLPWPGRTTGRRLHVATLHAPTDVNELRSAAAGSDVAEVLTTAMTTWAQDTGLTVTGPP